MSDIDPKLETAKPEEIQMSDGGSVKLPTQSEMEASLPQPPNDSPKWVLRGLLAFLGVLLTFIGYVGRLLGWWCLVLLLCVSAGASPWYIASTGADSNPGTKASPFLHDPRGPSFTGHWTHSATNDQFFYRGNDTFAGNYPLTVANAGKIVAGVTWVDYTGVDKTWFSGSQWGQPIFNAGGVPIALAGNNRFILNEDDNEVWDNICWTNFYWDSTSQSFGCSYISAGTYTNIQVINSLFTGWRHDTLAHGCNDNLKIIIGDTAGYNHGCLCSNCVFDGSASGGDSGNAIYCFPYIINCTITNMADALLVNGDPSIVTNCTIAKINASYDSSVHGAAWEIQGQCTTSWFANNIVHDNASGVTLGVGLAGGAITGPAYIIKNILWNTATGILLKWFSGANNQAHVWNNVIDVSSNPDYAILSEDGTWTTVDAQNNMVIGINSFSITASGGTVGNNVFWSSSTASANGFNSANLYYNAGNSAAVSPGSSSPSTTFTTDFNGMTFGPWFIGPFFYPSITQQFLKITGNGQIRAIGGGFTIVKGQ